MDGAQIELLMAGGRMVLTEQGEESAIRKNPIDGPRNVKADGLDGDDHAYHHHGGADKALLHYPAEHYDTYRRRFPRFSANLNGPRRGFGENISTHGITEEDVCLGDRYRIEPADPADARRGILVEVSGFRQPCWKLGFNCAVRDVPRLMQDQGKTGWYYRVIELGAIAQGDRIALVQRPFPEWTIGRLIRGFYGTPLDREFLAGVVKLPALAESLRVVMEHRLSSGVVESWDDRLYGHEKQFHQK